MSDMLAVLKAAMPSCKAPEAWAKAFERWTEARPLRDMPMFLAQIGHESSDLNRLEEDLLYKSVDRIQVVFPRSTRGLEGAALQALVRNPERLANVVYAFKGGNGNSLSGDGWKYRGRGPIQISLKGNYVALAKAIGVDVVTNPGLLVSSMDVAVQSALWFWRANVEDGGTIERVTRQINGPAMAGLEDRRARYLKAKAVV